MKLTKALKSILGACADWKAPYEVAHTCGTTTKIAKIRIDTLVRFGLLKYGEPNNTFRITESGRAALKEMGE